MPKSVRPRSAGAQVGGETRVPKSVCPRSAGAQVGGETAKGAQLCLILCNPRDCSPQGSSVQGILQARILEWIAIPSSRGSSQPMRGLRVLAGCLTEQGAEQLRNQTSDRLQTVILDVTKTESIAVATEWVKERVGDRGMGKFFLLSFTQA